MSMESFSDMFRDIAREFFEEEQKMWCQFEEALRGEHIVQDDFHICPVCKLRHHPEPVDWEPQVILGISTEPIMIGHSRCDLKIQFFYWKYGFLPGDDLEQ